jgi:hypothetical protein
MGLYCLPNQQQKLTLSVKITVLDSEKWAVDLLQEVK